MIDKNTISFYGVFKNSKGEKLVYYPCPKNANSSAKLFFAKQMGIDKNYTFLSDKIPAYKQTKKDFSIKKNLVDFLPSKQPFLEMPNDYIKCCIVRDPIKRFISAYKNRILYHKDKNFNDLSVNEVLNKLENGFFDNNHFLPQTYFLGTKIKYYDFYAFADQIEIFEKKVNNFFNKNVTFPKIQIGGNEYNINLSEKQINKIKKIYKSDYKFLDTT